MAYAQELPFVHYTTESNRNPLPSAAVTGVYQDRLGYLWFSVYSTGLVRYDGGTMETYAADDGLRDLEVFRLVEDAAGRLWVASRGGVVASDRPLHEYGVGARLRFTSRLGDSDLPSGLVNTNAISSGANGSVWIGAADAGLVRVEAGGSGTTVDTVRGPDATSIGEVTAVAGRSDGSMWVATIDGALRVVAPERDAHDVAEPGIQATYRGSVGSSGRHVSALLESSSGTLWAGTNEGELLRLAGSGEEAGFDRMSGTLGAVITTLSEGRDGTLWVGSEGGGVLRFDPESRRGTVYGIRHGLLGPTVHQIIVDAEGNLWFAQLGGVSKLRFNFEAFRSYTGASRRGERPVLPSTAVGAVAVAGPVLPAAPATKADGTCLLWAATSEGGIGCIHEDGTSAYLQSDRGLRSDWVNALALDEAGNLWIGSQAGIQRLVFDGAPGIGRGPVVSVGGRSARLAGFGPSQIAVFTISTAHVPVDGNGSAMTESLWFGGWDLFARIDGQWFVFGNPAGLPRARLHAVALDGAGRLWVSTQGEGIYRSRARISLSGLRAEEQRTIELTAPEGGTAEVSVIEGSLFEQVAVDAPGVSLKEVYRLLRVGENMWAATADGVVALRSTTGPEAASGGRSGTASNSGSSAGSDAVVVAAHLGKEHGLGADFTMSLAYAPATQTIWVGTNGGLSEIDPERRVVLRTLTTQDGLIGNEAWYTGSVIVGPDGAVYYGTARGLSVYQPSRDEPNTIPPRLRLRTARFTSSGGMNEFVAEYAALGFTEESRIRYRTRLLGYEDEWSTPRTDDRIRYTNLPAVLLSRAYTLEVLASNSSGTWTPEPLRYRFMVAPPPWLRWWALSLYVILLGAAVVAADRGQRARLIRRERQHAQIREAELAAETAIARSSAAEAESRALQEENRRKEAELEKARELEQAYQVLKVTQAQLIQSEKLASLGQLTAGIAHEIKNPLNFVTNFSALTREVANELIERSDSEPELPLAAVREDLDLIQLNTSKIEEHGLRADGIVRSMLEHSRGGPGERQSTDINALVEQYVNLAYHGERARTPDFELKIEQRYDREVGNVMLVQQELGRVLVNLLDNAFYAVRQQSLALNGQYVPRVCVATRRLERQVEIRVQDNGPGIPDAIRQKIFEPFFTTKPTGKGTGLGLSLSHNIIVQGCGGEFEVESTEGEGTTFVIRLPRPG